MMSHSYSSSCTGMTLTVKQMNHHSSGCLFVIEKKLAFSSVFVHTTDRRQIDKLMFHPLNQRIKNRVLLGNFSDSLVEWEPAGPGKTESPAWSHGTSKVFLAIFHLFEWESTGILPRPREKGLYKTISRDYGEESLHKALFPGRGWHLAAALDSCGFFVKLCSSRSVQWTMMHHCQHCSPRSRHQHLMMPGT